MVQKVVALCRAHRFIFVFRKRAAGILPAEGDHLNFVSRSEWARSDCRQDAGSTLSCHDEKMRTDGVLKSARAINAT